MWLRKGRLRLVSIFIKTFLTYDIHNPSVVVPLFLTLPVQIPDEERKLTQIIIFILFCSVFMKALWRFYESLKGHKKKYKNKNLSQVLYNFVKFTRREGWILSFEQLFGLSDNEHLGIVSHFEFPHVLFAGREAPFPVAKTSGNTSFPLHCSYDFRWSEP